jgi:hypothetical protein
VGERVEEEEDLGGLGLLSGVLVSKVWKMAREKERMEPAAAKKPGKRKRKIG